MSTTPPRGSWAFVINALAELGAKEIARRRAAELRAAVQAGDMAEVDRLLKEQDEQAQQEHGQGNTKGGKPIR